MSCLYFQHTVALICVSNVIAVLSLAALLSFHQASSQIPWFSDCCRSSHRLYHVCLGLPNERPIKIAKPSGDPSDTYWVGDSREDDYAQKCVSLFCLDGSDADGKHCGVGRCNVFGCQCEGGCRKGNGTGYATYMRVWLAKHDLVRETYHKFTG